MVLHLGKMTSKELAEWFGVSEQYFKRKECKEKKLEILKKYADYHLEGDSRKVVVIDEIFEDTYSADSGSPAFQCVKKLTAEHWDKSGYDTCSNVNTQIYPLVTSEGHEIKARTSYHYVCKGRTELYGSPIKHTSGSLGHCHYEWCKKDPETGKYLPLTFEENEVKRIISKKHNFDDDEITFLVAQIRKGKMNKDELWEYYKNFKEDSYVHWKEEVERALGFPIFQVTKVELFPKPNADSFTFE